VRAIVFAQYLRALTLAEQETHAEARAAAFAEARRLLAVAVALEASPDTFADRPR
jgi:hypothetical protein